MSKTRLAYFACSSRPVVAIPGLGQATGGIHWHMNIANKFTYFATDDQRQVIPWVTDGRRER